MYRRCVLALAASLTLLGAGCGGSDDGSPSAGPQTTPAVAADSSQAYRDRLTDIVRQHDDARGSFRAARGEQTVTAAQQLARGSRTAAHDVDALTPPAGLDLHGDLVEKYRRMAAALERELLRKPVSTERLGDVAREYGKAADHVYEEILIAP